MEELFIIENQKQRIINFLETNKDSFKTKECTIGIDSAVDKIVRLVKNKSQDNEKVFFHKMSEFGSHIIEKSGKSCGVEIAESFTKLGGNAPIMSNALGILNVKVNCVSPLGFPEMEPVFKELSDNCTLYSIGNPAYTTAIEFDDGKIMLGQVEYLDKIDWNTLKDILGLDVIKRFFLQSDLIGLVNWSCMINLNNIFNGILDEVLVNHNVNKSQIIFFDVSDFSKRSNKDICEALELINKFNKYYKVILGLNENEAILLYKALFNKSEPTDLSKLGQTIYDYLSIDTLVVHTLTNSIAFEHSKIVEVPSLFVQEPKLSTGGGDNFNVGLCFGQLVGLNMEDSLYTANATSGYYVRNAQSPSIEQLIETLENWDDLMEIPE